MGRLDLDVDDYLRLFRLLRVAHNILLLLVAGEFAENGSFIGQYGQKQISPHLTAAGVATIV